MRSIEARFRRSRNSTTITKFYDAIAYQNFSKDRIRRWFNTLVDPGDYHPSDKRVILQDLYRLTTKKNDQK